MPRAGTSLCTDAGALVSDAWLAVRNVMRPSKILRTAYRFIV